MSIYVSRALRVGVAFVFLYPPISAVFSPDLWIGYFPPFLLGIVSDAFLLHAFGIVEIVIALWIISGKNIFIPSTIATIMLVAIVLFNFSQIDVLFRDLAIAGMTLALAFDAYKKKSPGTLVRD